MRRAVLMLAASGGLFVATVIGLLALQGRLNHAGTRGIPIVQSWFAAPSGDLEDAFKGPVVTVPTGMPNPRVEGREKEMRLPNAPGPSVRDLPVEKAMVPRAGARGTPAAPGGAAGESVDGDPRSRLFELPRLPSGIGADELNEMVRAAQQRDEELRRRSAVLDQREADYEAREADIAERQLAVQALMREVESERKRLEEAVSDFERVHTVVRTGETARLREHAARLAAQDSVRAAGIVREMWRTEEGRARVVRVLKVMEADAVDSILGVLASDEARQILDRLADAVVEPERR